MGKESKTVAATLSEALDALTDAALQETLDSLEQESGRFERNCTIALSGKATYALSRPRCLEVFKLMIAHRLLQRYPRQKKRALERAERERPRLQILLGPVNNLVFKIGGTPEEIARETGSAPAKGVPTPTERGASGDVPF